MRRIFLTQQTTSSVCANFGPAHAPVHLTHPFVRVPRCAARLSFGGGLAFEGSWAFEHCPLRRHARRAPHHVVCQVVAAAILCMAFRRRLVSLKHAGDVKRAMRPTCRWTAGGWAERESKAMPWQPVASRPARSQTATEVAHERRHVYIFFLSPRWRLPSPNGCGFGEDSAKRTGNRLFCSNTAVPA